MQAHRAEIAAQRVQAVEIDAGVAVLNLHLYLFQLEKAVVKAVFAFAGELGIGRPEVFILVKRIELFACCLDFVRIGLIYWRGGDELCLFLEIQELFCSSQV